MTEVMSQLMVYAPEGGQFEDLPDKLLGRQHYHAMHGGQHSVGLRCNAVGSGQNLGVRIEPLVCQCS